MVIYTKVSRVNTRKISRRRKKKRRKIRKINKKEKEMLGIKPILAHWKKLHSFSERLSSPGKMEGH